MLEINTPLDGSTYSWMDELPGEARAYDPDNVDPDTCLPIGDFVADNGTGITTGPLPGVEFKVERFNGISWVTVHEQDQFSVLYCAFTGTPTCLKQGLGPPFEWPNDTPIRSGQHRLWARARDDEGVLSNWVHVEFTIDVDPTPTPSPTASNTPTPSATPSPVCTLYTLENFGSLSNEVWWTLTNGNLSSSAEMYWIEAEWTLSGNLDKIKLDSDDIWSGTASSPANITGGWLSPSRVFDPSDSKELRFHFNNSVGGSNITITVHFDDGCDVGDSQDA